MRSRRGRRGSCASILAIAVRVDYYDLFDPACPALPMGAQLPLVLVNGEVLSSGGKIAIPAIRRRVEALASLDVSSDKR